MSTGDHKDGGFTLMEVLISMAVIAMMMGLVWGSFSLTSRTKRQVEEIESRYHQIRLALSRIAREISMAYLSKNDQVATMTPRTMFVGQRQGSVDDLMFSNLAHLKLREDAKECDQSVIRYYSSSDPDNRRQTNLMRRETRRLGERKPEDEGAAYIILEDVEALHFEYFDESANEWKDSWSTTSADGQPDRLPQKVRIYLTVRDEKDKSITFISATRIFMQNPLWFSSGT